MNVNLLIAVISVIMLVIVISAFGWGKFKIKIFGLISLELGDRQHKVSKKKKKMRG